MRYEIDRDLIRQSAELEQSMAKRVSELGINDVNEAYIAGTIDTFNESQIAMEKNAIKNAVIGVLTGSIATTATLIIIDSIDNRFHISERVCKKLEDRKAKRSSKKN